MPMQRSTVATRVGGQVLAGAEGPAFGAIFTDTRDAVPGGLFVALRGERFDAHRFLPEAIVGGASGLVVAEREAVPAELPPGTFVIEVADTRQALISLAAAVRSGHRGRVIAVTGSVGKTTVKDMIAASLGAFGKTGRTPGNYNNDVGLPLTLFGFDGDEDFLVLELGMSSPGEIARLAHAARPHVGLVTGAVAAHLQFFRDVDEIADAKAELYDELEPDAVAVANADDPRVLERARALHPRNLLTYGYADGADVRILNAVHGPRGVMAVIRWNGQPITLELPVLGRHNAANAAAAIAVVRALGLDPHAAADRLTEEYRPAPHRMTVVHTPGGLSILDDCYNANPTSMRAALETFAEVSSGAAARGAVLGSMMELGDTAPELHREIGALAGSFGLDWLAFSGPHGADLAEGARGATASRVTVVEDAAELTDAALDFAGSDRWLLLKGSRSQRLERLIAPLSGLANGGGA